jgi:hypothetical protein
MEHSTSQSRWFVVRLVLAFFVLCFAPACTDSLPSDEGPDIQSVQLALPQDETTPIGKKWRALLDAGIVLGDPIATEQPVPWGAVATFQPYASHAIVYSNDSGAVVMPMAFFNKWVGLPNYSQFGVPKTDYESYMGIFDFVEFEGGWMISDGVGGARVVYGQIFGKFLANMRALGAPLTEEADTPGVPGGRFQAFSGGEVHWGKVWEGDPMITTDDRWLAAAVFEPILAYWRATGGPSAWLGLPTEDSAQLIAPDDDDPDSADEWIGHFGRFQGGTIYQNLATSSYHVLPGQALPTAWERHGGPKGWLGWPIAGYGTTASGKRFIDFATGVLVERQTPQGLVGEAFGDLKFHLGSVAGSDPCPNPFDPAPDLYFYVGVDSSQGPMVSNLPMGEFQSHPVPINGDLGSSKVANSALTITANVHIFDIDDYGCGGNEDLGRASFTYTIDNLWGLGMNDRHDTPGSRGWATFNIKSSHAFDEKDFRGQKYWSFHNFSTERLDHELYAETFADINDGFDPDDIQEVDPFIVFYYHTFFEGAANGGNCNGMNIESIHAQKGRSIMGMPIHSNPDTNGHPLNPFEPAAPGYDQTHAPLYKDINVKQASMLGADVILWKANEILRTLTFGLGGTFGHIRNFEDLGDYTTIGITRDKLGDAAHSLRPYRIDDTANSGNCEYFPGQIDCLKIWVADPNSPAGLNNPPAQDENRTRPDDNFIEFTNDGSEFCYKWPDPSTNVLTEYRGGLFGGFLWFEASHLYASPQVTPFNAGWLDLYRKYMFVVGSSGKTDQITDTQGRTMFVSVQGYPDRWDHIRRDAGRIPNVAPVMYTDVAGGPQGWLGSGVGETHDYDVIPTAGVAAQTPVPVALQSAGLSSIFSLPAIPGTVDRVTAHDINGPSKAISLTLPSNGTAKAVTWTISGGVKKRWMELSALGMSPAQNIRIRAENGGRRLRVTNAGPTTSAVLRYNDPDRAGGPVNLGTVTIEGQDASGAPGVTIIEPGSANCLSDSACAAGQYCDAGLCVVRPCSLTAPFGALLPVLPSGVLADGFALSPDGLTAYVSNDPGGVHQLYKTMRSSTTQPFGELTLVFPPSGTNERSPWLSSDGLRLYYESSATGSGDLVVSSRTSTNGAFGAPQVLDTVNGSSVDRDPFLISGETQLFFSSNRGGNYDLYSSTKNGSAFATPGALLNVNSPQMESHPVLGSDGLTLFFGSRRPSPTGDTDGDIWVSTRSPSSGNFETPQNLPVFNSSGAEFPVAISRDSCTLYFASNRETGLGGTDLYRVYSITRGQPQTMVTITLNIAGIGSVNTAPFACSGNGSTNTGTCSAQLAAGTSQILWGNRQAYWSDRCAANGMPGLSTDGVLTVTTSSTCTITFPEVP